MNVDSLNYFIMTTLQQDPLKNVSYGRFAKKDLEDLEKLSISTLTEIDNISILSNLKQLNIIAMNSKEYEVAKIINYDELNNLSDLETLAIINNQHIDKLDISNLNNLKRLILVSNYNLKEIMGLDKLTNLEQIVIVGNSINNIEWLKGYLDNTKNSNINILDYKLFNRIIQDKDKYDYLTNLEISYDTNLSFAEKIGIGEIFIYSFQMMQRVYEIARKIVDDNITDEMTDEEKIETLYKYVVSNLEYDNENLAKRAKYVSTNSNLNIYSNKFKYINSSYGAFTSGKAVCEGYANMLIFLLNMVGIESRIVYCNVKGIVSENQDYYSHAANKIKIDNKWYYFDSQLETNINELRYYKKTKEEFYKTHDILYIAEIDDNSKIKSK